jgi:hypothetical protein
MPIPVIVYDVFSNDGHGGPIDYTTPIGTTSSLSYVLPSLATSADWSFGVRSRDTANAVTDLNVDARVRIHLDASGNDLASLPNPPVSMNATPSKAGGVYLTWQYERRGQGALPKSFKVYITPVSAGSPSWITPAASIAFRADRDLYAATVGGLSNGVEYFLGVRSSNDAGIESNVNVLRVVGDNSPPTSVLGLSSELFA